MTYYSKICCRSKDSNDSDFVADNGTIGQELWRSNGTGDGTELVADINPGADPSYPRYLTNVNGLLFFSATTSVSGSELWVSNGVAAGTFLAKDINPGVKSSNPSNLANINGRLFLTATDGSNGYELWTVPPAGLIRAAGKMAAAIETPSFRAVAGGVAADQRRVEGEGWGVEGGNNAAAAGREEEGGHLRWPPHLARSTRVDWLAMFGLNDEAVAPGFLQLSWTWGAGFNQDLAPLATVRFGHGKLCVPPHPEDYAEANVACMGITGELEPLPLR
jgi:ELWxxDGT repeat protein